MTIRFLFTTAAMGLMALASTSYAQDETAGGTLNKIGSYLSVSHFPKDFGVSVGLKGWFNQWETSGSLQFVDDAGNTSSAENPGFVFVATSEDTEFTPIPVFNLRYKNFLFSGSFYPSTDFKFPLRSFNNPGTSFYTTNEISAERDEWDMTGGYYLSRYIVLLGGYKKITQDFTSTTQLVDFEGQPFLPEINPPETKKTTTEISGPILGAAAAVPIGRGFGFFGSYAHGFLESKFSGPGVNKKDEDSPYDLIELGISYTHVPKKGGAGFFGSVGNYIGGISGYFGYRVQLIKTETKKNTAIDDETPDTTEGFTLGFNVAL
jgi:hypothetical protein